MLIENIEQLKEWLTDALQPICEADPGALAKYVVALVKKDKTIAELKESCHDQLDVFLQTKTKDFVETLFTALENKSYVKAEAPQPVVRGTEAPPLPDVVAAPAAAPAVAPEPVAILPVKPAEQKKKKEEESKEDVPPRDTRRKKSRSPSPRNRDDRRRRYDDRPTSFDRRYPWRNSDDRNRSLSPRSRTRGRRRSRSPIRRRSPFRPIQRSHSPRGRGRPRSRSRSRSRSWSRSPRRSWSRSRSGSRSRFRSRSRSRTPPRIRSKSRSPRPRSRSPRPRSPRIRSRSPIPKSRSPGARQRSPRRTRSGSPRRRSRSPVRRSRSPRIRSRGGSRSSRSPRGSRSKSRSLTPPRKVKRLSPDSRGPTPTQDNGMYQEGPGVPGSSSVISVVTVGRFGAPESGQEDRHQGLRCRDFDEKGFCVKGDMCPYDHGTDPVVVEDVNITANVPPFPPGGLPRGPGMPPVSRPPIGPHGEMLMIHPPPGFPPPPRPDMAFQRPQPGMGMPPGPRMRPDFPPEGYNPEAPAITLPPPPYWPGGPNGPPPPHFMPQGPPPHTQRPPGPPSTQSQLSRQRDLVSLTATAKQQESKEEAEEIEPPSSSTRTVIAPKEDKMNQPPPPGVQMPPAPSQQAPMPMHPQHNVRPQRFHPYQNQQRFGGPRKPFDYSRIGGYRRPEIDRTNATLEVRKVPREDNNIAKLNEHFGKFGTLVNIQVAFEGDPEAATITFSSNAEAHSCYKSSEPVFNNRFIKLFWHNKNKTENGANNSQEQAPTSTTTPGFGEDSSRPSAKARLGPLPSPSQLQLNNLTKKKESQSAEDPAVERNIVYTSSMGSISKTVYNPDALKAKAAAQKSLTSPTAVKAADFVLRIENMKKQEDLKKEAAKNRLELQKQKQQLLEKQIKQQKLLIQKLEQNKNLSTEEKGPIMNTLKTVTTSIDKLKSDLLGRKVVLKKPTTPEAAKLKSPEQAKKEILDTELELMTKTKEGADTLELKKKLLELTKEASSMGLLGRGRGRGAAARGRGFATWVAGGVKEAPAVVPGRGRARGGFKSTVASRTLDRRPKVLELSGFKAEEKDDIQLQLYKLDSVEKIDIEDKANPCAIVTFNTRHDAEMGILVMNKFKTSTPLKIQWHIPKPVITRSLSNVSADTDDIDTEGNFDDIDEEALLAGEDEEDDEDEDRSWRR